MKSTLGDKLEVEIWYLLIFVKNIWKYLTLFFVKFWSSKGVEIKKWCYRSAKWYKKFSTRGTIPSIRGADSIRNRKRVGFVLSWTRVLFTGIVSWNACFISLLFIALAERLLSYGRVSTDRIFSKMGCLLRVKFTCCTRGRLNGVFYDGNDSLLGDVNAEGSVHRLYFRAFKESFIFILWYQLSITSIIIFYKNKIFLSS